MEKPKQRIIRLTEKNVLDLLDCGLDDMVRMDSVLSAIRDVMASLEMGTLFANNFIVECFRQDGSPKWVGSFANIVVNTGLDETLEQVYKGAAYTAAHYVGMTDGTPTVAATDTMASHAGWVEVTAYDEANRPSLVLGTVSGQSVDNSASKATITCDTNSTTIGGAFVSTDNTKGGTSGILMSAGAFTQGDKSVDDNETLQTTITLTAAAS